MSRDQLPPLPTSHKNASSCLSPSLSEFAVLFLTKRPHSPARFLLTCEMVKGECEMHFVLLCPINGKQFLHFLKNLPLVIRAVVEKKQESAREHLKCYLTVVKI